MTFVIFIVDIKECDSSPCRHGGTCTDAMNRYTCKCNAGYTGTSCETSEIDLNELNKCVIDVFILVMLG